MKTALIFLLLAIFTQTSFAGEREYVAPVRVGHVTPALDVKKVSLAESYIQQICPQYGATNGASAYVWDTGAIQFKGLSAQSQEFVLKCDKSGSARN